MQIETVTTDQTQWSRIYKSCSSQLNSMFVQFRQLHNIRENERIECFSSEVPIQFVASDCIISHLRHVKTQQAAGQTLPSPTHLLLSWLGTLPLLLSVPDKPLLLCLTTWKITPLDKKYLVMELSAELVMPYLPTPAGLSLHCYVVPHSIVEIS